MTAALLWLVLEYYGFRQASAALRQLDYGPASAITASILFGFSIPVRGAVVELITSLFGAKRAGQREPASDAT